MSESISVMESIRHSTAAFTGHRKYGGEADDELRLVVQDLYNRGITRFLCGMSWGFDLAAGSIPSNPASFTLLAVKPKSCTI